MKVKKFIVGIARCLNMTYERIDKDILKLQIFSVEKMSDSGLGNWNIRIRRKAKPVVFKPYLRVDVNVNEFTNRQEIGDWTIREIGEEGKYQIRAWGHAKNKYHCSPRKIATVELVKVSDGLRANVEVEPRLKRYRWFYND